MIPPKIIVIWMRYNHGKKTLFFKNFLICFDDPLNKATVAGFSRIELLSYK